MIETKKSGMLNGPTDEAKLGKVQQAQEDQVNAEPPPVQRPKPGRKPLFRN